MPDNRTQMLTEQGEALQPVEVHPAPDYGRIRAILGDLEQAQFDISDSHPIVGSATIDSYQWGLTPPIFVEPDNTYPSYSDFWTLVELAGWETKRAGEIDLNNPDKVYIFAGPEGIPDCTHARARTIFWQLEYVGDYTDQPNHRTVSEVWSSDPEHAIRTGAKYVLMGSDKRLNPQWNKRKPNPVYDIVTLAYMTARRERIYQQLGAFSFAPWYPGHSGEARHNILRRSRLMLHVHQHNTAAHTPLRYALAAAYKLTLLSEWVSSSSQFGDSIVFAHIDDIPALVAKLSGETLHLPPGLELFDLLCVKNTFEHCVLEALGNDLSSDM